MDQGDSPAPLGQYEFQSSHTAKRKRPHEVSTSGHLHAVNDSNHQHVFSTRVQPPIQPTPLQYPTHGPGFLDGPLPASHLDFLSVPISTFPDEWQSSASASYGDDSGYYDIRNTIHQPLEAAMNNGNDITGNSGLYHNVMPAQDAIFSTEGSLLPAATTQKAPIGLAPHDLGSHMENDLGNAPMASSANSTAKDIDGIWFDMLWAYYHASGNKRPQQKDLFCLHGITGASLDALGSWFDDISKSSGNNVEMNFVSDGVSQEAVTPSSMKNSQAQQIPEDSRATNLSFAAPQDHNNNKGSHKQGQPSNSQSQHTEPPENDDHDPTLSQGLRDLIEAEIDSKKTGCPRIKASERRHGKFQCPSGCGRSFQCFTDFHRHVETSCFPQHFWYCGRCGDLEAPTSRYLFIRKDKFQKHVKSSHSNWPVAEALHGSRLDFAAPFPSQCGFCDRTGFYARDFRHWINHIARHFREGALMSQWTSWPEQEADEDEDGQHYAPGQPAGDDSDDDDDGDDDDGDDNNGNDDGDDRGDDGTNSNHAGGSGPTNGGGNLGFGSSSLPDDYSSVGFDSLFDDQSKDFDPGSYSFSNNNKLMRFNVHRLGEMLTEPDNIDVLLGAKEPDKHDADPAGNIDQYKPGEGSLTKKVYHPNTTGFSHKNRGPELDFSHKDCNLELDCSHNDHGHKGHGVDVESTYQVRKLEVQPYSKDDIVPFPKVNKPDVDGKRKPGPDFVGNGRPSKKCRPARQLLISYLLPNQTSTDRADEYDIWSEELAKIQVNQMEVLALLSIICYFVTYTSIMGTDQFDVALIKMTLCVHLGCFGIIFARDSRLIAFSKKAYRVLESSGFQKKGGTARIWLLRIPLRPQEGTHRKSTPTGHQYAVKTYSSLAVSSYKREIEALMRLRSEQHMMIQTFGAYVDFYHGSRTYNIILEHAECDLADYFHIRSPPRNTTDINAFWKSLSDIANALKFLHDSSVGTNNEVSGWHADIKPDNILVFGQNFKLADFGFTVFEKKTSQYVPGRARTVLRGGTRAYGAPETELGTFRPMSQTVDIWSLGCVYSIAATWLVAGSKGVVAYRNLRSKCLSNPLKQKLAGTKVASPCFHDGHDVLMDVTSWHKGLRHYITSHDRLTSRILNLIDNDMLMRDPDQRITSAGLVLKLCRLFNGLDRIYPAPSELSNLLSAQLSYRTRVRAAYLSATIVLLKQRQLIELRSNLQASSCYKRAHLKEPRGCYNMHQSEISHSLNYASSHSQKANYHTNALVELMRTSQACRNSVQQKRYTISHDQLTKPFFSVGRTFRIIWPTDAETSKARLPGETTHLPGLQVPGYTLDTGYWSSLCGLMFHDHLQAQGDDLNSITKCAPSIWANISGERRMRDQSLRRFRATILTQYRNVRFSPEEAARLAMSRQDCCLCWNRRGLPLSPAGLDRSTQQSRIAQRGRIQKPESLPQDYIMLVIPGTSPNGPHRPRIRTSGPSRRKPTYGFVSEEFSSLSVVL